MKKHVADWLAEGNAKDKADADAILVSNGIDSRNDVRRKRGQNSIGPDGDKHTVQLNMTTLERIGEDQAPPETPAEAVPAIITDLAGAGLEPVGSLVKELNRPKTPRTPAPLTVIEGGRHAAK